jgi:Domain of unknown function (DUF4920)
MQVIKGMARVAAFGLMAVAAVSAAGDEKFGKGVSLTEATSIKALYETPDKFVGKTIRIDGVVTAVCEEMGCWMALGETDKAQNTVRLKVEHDAGIVFPIAAKGKNASAEGVFEKIADGDKEAKEAAAEQAAQTKGSDFAKKYQLKATGAIVK